MTIPQFGDRPRLFDLRRSEASELADDMPSGFRADIEGLRAVAVIVVLLYHAHLGPTHGGFLGVDVFFVLSGYLITSLLMKDLLVRGSRSLATFWGRRARRLLPASLLVVVVTLIAGRFMLDPLKQRDLAHDALWASGFVINIKFAMGDSYAVAQTTPTPLLHYWSLAVEEQFYVVWPFLLFAVTRVRQNIRATVLGTLGALFAISFWAYVHFGERARTPVFFLLPTRAWELIAGAMLALTGSAALRLSPTVRAAVGWFGLFVIGYCVVSYDDTMTLGWAALLPVLATVAVVGAAGRGYANEPAGILGIRPMVWIGRRSYGIYLWHWPALVLIDAKYGPLSAPVRILVLAGAVGAAALSYRYLENPVRHSPWLAVTPRRSLLLGASLVAAGALAAGVMIALPTDTGGGGVVAAPTLPGASTSAPGGTTPSTSPNTGSTVTPTLETMPPHKNVVPMAQLIAAGRKELDAGAQTTKVPSNATPPVAIAKGDQPAIYRDGCVLPDGTTEAPTCLFGDLNSPITVALFGDSHAAQWFPALEQLAHADHWKLEVLVKRGCPTADVRIKRRYLDPECVTWRQKVVDRLTTDHPTLLIISSTNYDPGGSDVGLNSDQVWRRGLEKTMSEIRPTADKLLILGDTPLPAHEVPNCLAAFPGNVQHCMAPRTTAIDTSRLQVEREIAAAHQAEFAPTSDWLCGTSWCPVIVGNIVMYRDNNHVSATGSRYLAPFVESAVIPILQS